MQSFLVLAGAVALEGFRGLWGRKECSVSVQIAL